MTSADLSAARELVERYVTPAAPLLVDGPEGTRFDLEHEAGRKLPGLTLGLLADRFPDLNDPPDAAALGEALDELGLEVTDPERRSRLLTAWMALRALWVMREAVDVVSDHRSGDPAAEAELVELERLSEAPLPTLDRVWIERAIDTRRRGRG